MQVAHQIKDQANKLNRPADVAAPSGPGSSNDIIEESMPDEVSEMYSEFAGSDYNASVQNSGS